MLAGDDSMRHTQLVNYALYQGGWFACVLSASWRHPWVGLAIALVLIGAHLTLSSERLVECRLVILATIVGTAVEIVSDRRRHVPFHIRNAE